jgi:hypothetical protein
MEPSDNAVAQKWFEFMVNMPALKYLEPQDEVRSRAVLNAAKEASGESAFDRELAQQMNALSVNEREQQFEEMHGVSRAINETPEMVAAALNQFHHCVMMVTEKPWYDHAVALNRPYIEGAKFRLMFLRAELFNVSKAVTRMLLFLGKKAKFFGPHTLGRPLQLGDLDEEAMKVLRSGDYQVLPSRDRAGRPILFQVSPHCGKKSYDCGLPLVRFLGHQVLTGAHQMQTFSSPSPLVVLFQTSSSKHGSIYRSISLKRTKNHRSEERSCSSGGWSLLRLHRPCPANCTMRHSTSSDGYRCGLIAVFISVCVTRFHIIFLHAS